MYAADEVGLLQIVDAVASKEEELLGDDRALSVLALLQYGTVTGHKSESLLGRVP